MTKQFASSTPFQAIRGAVALAGLIACMGHAQAQLTVTPHDAVIAPGQSSVLALDVDFGSGIQVAGFTFEIQFDPMQLTLALDSLNYGGSNPVDVGTVFAADPFTVSYDPSSSTITGTWAGLNNLDLNGAGSVKLLVTNSGLSIGQSSFISYKLSYDDENLNSQGPFTATSTITAAVPEPETWGLALAGVVVLGAWARRRHA